MFSRPRSKALELVEFGGRYRDSMCDFDWLLWLFAIQATEVVANPVDKCILRPQDCLKSLLKPRTETQVASWIWKWDPEQDRRAELRLDQNW